MLRASAAVLAASGLLAFAASGSAMTHPMLVGTTGPGFSIDVTKAGKDVKTLPAGTYTLVVKDKSAIHNFHLIGPGVNKVATSVAFIGTKTLTVTLKKGTYRYQCDVHVTSGMKGSFKVT